MTTRGPIAKPIRLVLFVDDSDGVWECYAAMLKLAFKDRYDLRFRCCKRASELAGIAAEQAIDLIVLNDSRVRWDIPCKTADSTDGLVFLAGL